MNFQYFKSVVGITLVLVLIIAFVNLLSIENIDLQLMEFKKSRLSA